MQQMIRLMAKIDKLEDNPQSLDILQAMAEKHSMPSVDVGFSDDVPACYPRFAIQLLAKVMAAPGQRQVVIASDHTVRDTTARLVKALLSHGGWKVVRLSLES